MPLFSFMNEHDPQIALLTERIERLTSQLETNNEKLDRVLDPEVGVYAKGAALENRVATIERELRYGKWLIGVLIVQAIAYARDLIAKLLN